MGRTLDELGATMSSAEFSMWVQLYTIDPWDEHVDLGLGTVAAMIGNYAGKMRSEGSRDLQASDFMPLPAPEPVTMIEPDPVAFFKAI